MRNRSWNPQNTRHAHNFSSYFGNLEAKLDRSSCTEKGYTAGGFRSSEVCPRARELYKLLNITLCHHAIMIQQALEHAIVTLSKAARFKDLILPYLLYRLLSVYVARKKVKLHMIKVKTVMEYTKIPGLEMESEENYSKGQSDKIRTSRIMIVSCALTNWTELLAIVFNCNTAHWIWNSKLDSIEESTIRTSPKNTRFSLHDAYMHV